MSGSDRSVPIPGEEVGLDPAAAAPDRILCDIPQQGEYCCVLIPPAPGTLLRARDWIWGEPSRTVGQKITGRSAALRLPALCAPWRMFLKETGNPHHRREDSLRRQQHAGSDEW